MDKVFLFNQIFHLYFENQQDTETAEKLVLSSYAANKTITSSIVVTVYLTLNHISIITFIKRGSIMIRNFKRSRTLPSLTKL